MYVLWNNARALSAFSGHWMSWCVDPGTMAGRVSIPALLSMQPSPMVHGFATYLLYLEAWSEVAKILEI